MATDPAHPHPLDAGEVEGRVSKRWHVEGDELVAEVRCENFRAALELANQVGAIAEELNHHPDLTVSWGRLGIRCSTHSIGGLSERDVELAGRIDQVVDAAQRA
jgi:4a-hydroxytetrahydrobiopterin dehydratase